jgi:hypothetical protein
LLGRPRGTREDNIKVDLNEMCCEGVDIFSCLRIEFGGGSYDHGNDPEGFIEGIEIFDQRKNRNEGF